MLSAQATTPRPPHLGEVDVFSCTFVCSVAAFKRLHRLVLWGSVEQRHEAAHLHHSPIELPVLESIVIVGSISLCQQLARALHFPSTCSRTVTTLFPVDRPYSLDDAAEAAYTASMFIPQDLRFAGCIINGDANQPSLRLTVRNKQSVLIRFNVRGISVQIGGFAHAMLLLK